MTTKCDRLEGLAKERCFDVVHSLSPAMLQLIAHEMVRMCAVQKSAKELYLPMKLLKTHYYFFIGK